MPWTPTTSRAALAAGELDLNEINEQLERTEWEVGYTPAKLAQSAIARPVPRTPTHQAGRR